MISSSTLVPTRLANQRLLGSAFANCVDAVSWLGAVQGQDFYAAKWALGVRVKNSDDASVEAAFNDGAYLRVHAMRPTWHLVTPADIRWLQMLTGPRVHAANAYYYRKLELDADTFKRSNAALSKALEGGKFLTRNELKEAFEAVGISAKGLRLAYLIMYAELEALICNGPMKGKQHTYALLEERVPKAKSLTRDEALATLTKRYFVSHGPAQELDFSWWSGLTLADAKRGLEMNDQHLHSQVIDGKKYWFADASQPKIKPPLVHLLPNYDEYLIAYKDRNAFFDRSLIKSQAVIEEVLYNHFVVLNGQVVGGWKRALEKNAVHINATLLTKLSAEETAALKAEAKRYGDFLGLKPEVAIRFA